MQDAISRLLALAAQWEAAQAYCQQNQPIRYLEIEMLGKHAREVREAVVGSTEGSYGSKDQPQ